MSKDENCACKNTVFHRQICKFVGFLLPSSSWLLKLPSLAPREELIVFAYQIWKPQLLSVVQFPFDNCHSSFSPTTFFEIGVYCFHSFPPSRLGIGDFSVRCVVSGAEVQFWIKGFSTFFLRQSPQVADRLKTVRPK